MENLRIYDIQWKGLSNGKHHIEFDIDNDFFTAFENSDITGGNLKVDIELSKTSSALSLDVHIEGDVVTVCDRCLGELSLPVDYDDTLTVKFSDEIADYDGETMWLHPDDGILPLAQYLYESIVLSLPYRRIHGTDDNGEPLCDKEMLSRFKIISQEEFDAIEAKSNTLENSDANDALQKLRAELEKNDNNE